MSVSNYPSQIIQRTLTNERVGGVPIPAVASGPLTTVSAIQDVAGATRGLILTPGTWLVNGNGRCNFSNTVTSCEVMCITFDYTGGARQSASNISVTSTFDFTANTSVPFSLSDLIIVAVGTTVDLTFNITYTGLINGGATVLDAFVVANRIGDYPVSISEQVGN